MSIQEVLNATNFARTNPRGFMRVLQQRRQYYQGKKFIRPGETPILTKEGVSALDEAIQFLSNISPIPPVSLESSISRAAKDHVNDIGPNRIVGHNGSDGSNPYQRMDRYGESTTGYRGENISFGKTDPMEILIQLIVDDGVPSRDHRNNIFKKEFKLVGIAIGPHSVYKCCCVIDYAEDFCKHDNCCERIDNCSECFYKSPINRDNSMNFQNNVNFQPVNGKYSMSQSNQQNVTPHSTSHNNTNVDSKIPIQVNTTSSYSSTYSYCYNQTNSKPKYLREDVYSNFAKYWS